MLKHVRVLVTLAVAFFVTSGNAAAQPVEWHFIGVASYQHNLNRPGSASNQFRIFDTSDKTMRLNLAGLSLVKAAAPFGFQVDLVSGKDVPLFASAGAPNPKGIDFKQAFVAWKAPGGLEIRAGKFNTTAGYEVIPDWSNQNGNYSISFLSGYAMPITHTGLRASYPLTPATTLTAGVNRGWDKITDNNASPSYELAVTSTPSPWLSSSASSGFRAPTDCRCSARNAGRPTPPARSYRSRCRQAATDAIMQHSSTSARSDRCSAEDKHRAAGETSGVSRRR